MEKASIGSAFRACMRGAVRPVRWIFSRTALAISPSTVIQGFIVVDLIIAKHDAGLFDRVAQVLDLVHSTDARRWQRMRHDVQRILIMHTGVRAGSYWGELNACVLDANHLRDDDVRSVAMTLAHEAMHARLEQAGFGYPPSQRTRIERLCLKAEIALGERLPDSDGLVEEARRAMDEVWWSIDARNERQAQELRVLGWPKWAVRLRGVLFRE